MMLTQEKLKKDTESLKVFLVLFLKGFSWQKELEYQFNISSKIVKKTLPVLEKLGLIIARDFYSLDLNTQDSIRRMSAVYMSSIKNYPKIYTLSAEGSEFGKTLQTDLEELVNESSTFKFSYDLILEKTNAYNKIKEEHDLIENTELTRDRIDPLTGILFQTETKKSIKIKKERIIAMREFKKELLLEKQEQNLLTSKEKNELIVISKTSNLVEYTENEYSKEYYTRTQLYNGKNITQDELNRLEAEIELKKKEDLEPAKVGLDLVEVENVQQKRIDNLKNFLGIDDNIIEVVVGDSDLICKNLINEIKDKGWMDFGVVKKICGTNKIFYKFIGLATKSNIIDDGEDFVYTKS